MLLLLGLSRFGLAAELVVKDFTFAANETTKIDCQVRGTVKITRDSNAQKVAVRVAAPEEAFKYLMVEVVKQELKIYCKRQWSISWLKVNENHHKFDITIVLPQLSELNLAVAEEGLLVIGQFDHLKVEASCVNNFKLQGNGTELILKQQGIGVTVCEGRIDRVDLALSGYVETYLSNDFSDLAVKISGKCRVTGVKQQQADQIAVTSSGGGSLLLPNLNKVGDLQLDLRGSATIDMPQVEHINRLGVTISGSGDVKAPQAVVRSAKVKIRGSGQIELATAESLNFTNSGSGKIRFTKSDSEGKQALTKDNSEVKVKEEL